MMLGYYILIAFLIAGVSMMFGYVLGSVMTTAKIADKEADKERQERENGNATWRKQMER